MTAEASDPGAAALAAHVALWDWRRRVAGLYAEIRGLEPPRLAWQLWRETRDELFRTHAQSPLEPARRPAFAGVPLFDYDPALRLVAGLEPTLDRAPVTLSGGGDGAVRILPFARTVGLERRLGGELTLYWIAGYGGGVFLPFQDRNLGPRDLRRRALSARTSSPRRSGGLTVGGWLIE